MSSAAETHRAVAHLKKVDPKLAAVITKVGKCEYAPRRERSHFEAVLSAIVSQQLSGKAAATIYSRFTGLFDRGTPAPQLLLDFTDGTLRAAGLSRQKIGYMRDLATRVLSGALPIDALDDLTDQEVLDALVQVKGVGRWTAQMFLMFRLGRPDILPDLDLGIQNAIQRAYRLRKRPAPKRVLEIGAKWAPYRTIASWYLWRSLDNR